MQPRALPGPEQRQKMWNKDAARVQTFPHHRVPVHFCLCHLPPQLKGSHDGFIGFLISFQLSLITLQISKSSQAKADRDRSRPSATRSWSSQPHLQQVPRRHALHQGSVQMGGMPNHPGPGTSLALGCPCQHLLTLGPLSGNTTEWKNVGVSDQRFSVLS